MCDLKWWWIGIVLRGICDSSVGCSEPEKLHSDRETKSGEPEISDSDYSGLTPVAG